MKIKQLRLEFKGSDYNKLIRILGIFLLAFSVFGQSGEKIELDSDKFAGSEVGEDKPNGLFSNLVDQNKVTGWKVSSSEVEDPKKVEDQVSELNITSRSAIAVSKSGYKLFEKQSQEKLLPASTVKIMTALVALDEYSLGDTVRIPEGCAALDGNKAGLIAGDYLKVEDLLYATLVSSGNDGACSLYFHAGNNKDSFVKKMNNQLSIYGLVNTHFSNPIGYDDDPNSNYTTAEDLAKLANIALKKGIIRKIVGTREVTLISSIPGRVYRIRNTNDLLHTMPGIIGVKTGFTENAGGNLVAAYDHNGEEIIVVVMGSSDRFGDTRLIIDWVFQNYQW